MNSWLFVQISLLSYNPFSSEKLRVTVGHIFTNESENFA